MGKLLNLRVMVLWFILGTPPGVLGYTVEIPVPEYAYIHDGNEGSRLLIRFRIPEFVQSGTLDAAVLRLACEIEGPAVVELRLISAGWDPGTVSWSYPWSAPGGDLRTDLVIHRSFCPQSPGGAESAALDITPFLEEMLATQRNYGIAIVPSERNPDAIGQTLTFRPEDHERTFVRLYYGGAE